jgi:hypothetical protein
VVLVLIPIVFVSVVCAVGTTISVEPATVNVSQVGITFKINITITQVTDLKGWEFKLFYPNSVLNATGIQEGPFLKKVGYPTNFFNFSFSDHYNATHGRIWAACIIMNQPPHGADGNGTLATITFKTTSGGDGILHLAETDLENSAPDPVFIPHTTLDGIVHVLVGIKDVAVTNIFPFKTVIGLGYSLSTKVTVENQGTYGVDFNVTLYASKPIVNIASFHLFGSTGYGWGLAANSITSPGPTITVKKGDLVNLTLTSADLQTHNFFVDYNGDAHLSVDEPASPDFCNPPYCVPTINFQFTADRLGVFTYYCLYDTSAMFGTFIVSAPTIQKSEIGTQSVFLNSGVATNLTFVWNTAGYGYGAYNMSAYSWPLVGETDTADNTFYDGIVKVTIPGDVNGDFYVDIKDATQVGMYWMQLSPPAPANVDINGDGLVSIKDATPVGLNWLKHA